MSNPDPLVNGIVIVGILTKRGLPLELDVEGEDGSIRGELVRETNMGVLDFPPDYAVIPIIVVTVE